MIVVKDDFQNLFVFLQDLLKPLLLQDEKDKMILTPTDSRYLSSIISLCYLFMKLQLSQSHCFLHSQLHSEKPMSLVNISIFAIVLPIRVYSIYEQCALFTWPTSCCTYFKLFFFFAFVIF